ncbi:Hsp70 family protein [Plantactinospora soyae]|uniref:Ethanolamine utilization protein EutJ (Predicted chaperonin) n=1 Tax=Plantactinospora soyae TaxID=1544732 RepID=A0A927R677_9ACTN|nr:Hsp70 family protein [Plantactinospora soyae]MBE1486586.1 Ethanolamine utilization protein EutJ (predicted chaperonin) [Plantactinospora soyae]
MAGQDAGFGLGVDLGTSHTVAVLRWPDGRTRPLLFDGQPILPSGVFLDSAGRAHVGRDAQRLAQADPARYEPNPKRRIDESAVLLGDREFPTVDLLASVLGAVANAAVEAVGFLPPAVLSYPATWGARRREALAAAVGRAGWPPVTGTDASSRPSDSDPSFRSTNGTLLVPEPVAAARYFADVLRRPVPVGSALAVFDFGGGTLDIAVVRNEGIDETGRARFVVIGSGGVADLGGLDLDAALVQHLGGVIGTAHGPVWQQLSQPVTASQWRSRRQFWDDVRGAKEMLSRATTAPVPVPGVEQALHLTRDELESVVTPLLRRGVYEAASVLANCRLSVDQLAGLFLVGGSSRVPLVARLLHADLGIAPTVLEQPELPVAEGALAELSGTALATVAAPTVRDAAGVPTSPAALGTAALSGQAGPYQGGPVATVSAPPSQSPGPHQQGTGPHQQGAGPHQQGTGPHQQSPGPYPAGVPAGHSGRPDGSPPYGAGSAPSSPSGLAGLVKRPPPRAIWIGAAALVALLAVVGAAALYLTRDRHPAIDFAPFAEISRVAARVENPTSPFTAMAGDRAYVAYQREDQQLDIAVAQVQADTAEVSRWFTTGARAERWDGIKALPDVLLVRADAASTSALRDLIAFDPDNGKQLWSRQVRGDDPVYYFDQYVVLLDRTAATVVGINARTGKEWSQPSPQGQYDNASEIYAMNTAEEVGGAALNPNGDPALPNRGDDPRLVQIGADGSIRVLDVTNGRVLKTRANAADTDDFVLAYDGQLFVASPTDGYGLARYDLATLGSPTNVYTAPDKSRRPRALEPCGEEQVCLLEGTGSDDESTELVAVRTDDRADSQEPAWRKKVPQAQGLVPVGENILVRIGSSDRSSRLFTPDGENTLTRDGVAVRVDGGNVLAFDAELTTYADDASVAGVNVGSAKTTELGQLKKIIPASCSWNSSVIVCPTGSEFVFARFTGG